MSPNSPIASNQSRPDVPGWRAMRAGDVAPAYELSRHVHPAHPERQAVLAEKFALYPAGCFVRPAPGEGRVLGYCFSHPWAAGAPPALDGFLGALPVPATSYFVHDLTLHESLRGQGLGRALVPELFAAARAAGLSHMSLVAVGGRAPFWTAAGFAATADAGLQQAARAKYGEGAVHMERRL